MCYNEKDESSNLFLKLSFVVIIDSPMKEHFHGLIVIIITNFIFCYLNLISLKYDEKRKGNKERENQLFLTNNIFLISFLPELIYKPFIFINYFQSFKELES